MSAAAHHGLLVWNGRVSLRVVDRVLRVDDPGRSVDVRDRPHDRLVEPVLDVRVGRVALGGKEQRLGRLQRG